VKRETTRFARDVEREINKNVELNVGVGVPALKM
jgi:hypothetical protein